jgi:hypothetical protein
MSFHEDFRRYEAHNEFSDRSFGLALTLWLMAIALWPLFGRRPIRWWALLASAVFALTAIAHPSLLHPANRLVNRFAFLINQIMNPVVMGLLFYLIVTPTAIVMRVFGKDSLRLRFDMQAPSYWIRREPPGPSPESMSRQF